MHEIFERTTVIPVLTIEHLEDALPLASALVHGGLNVLEVTFRTEAAAAAIAAIARGLPDAVVGAGTLLRPNDITQALEAGAKFLVSPGLMPDLVATGLAASDVPYLPGVATASEVMTARGLGCSLLKFFPATAMGGPTTLAAFAPVFRGIAFCPTGGITEDTAPNYLRLPNVPMVGGAWMVPAAAVAERDWARITSLAKRAASLKRGG
jgi:2-dehydro-3-deoxyphosphogluconate aldolase / (4S)-4-hydroxy-2-oxoglutarate aldolase